MKKIFQLLALLLMLLTACNNSEKKITTENDIDAARNFIRAALDGEYEKGKNLLVPDSTNFQYYEAFEKSHKNFPAEEKKKYSIASINVHGIRQVNDSTSIVIYSNSYKNDHDTLKILKLKGNWLVDLKYLFNHDMDTLQWSTNKPNSLK